MTENDTDDFIELWTAACENSGFKTEPSDAAINLAFDVLQGYAIKDIAIAIVKFQRMPGQALTPAIIESIITGISWLTPAEAWAIAQKTFDNGVSVILTNEIAQAANSAKPLYLDNQRVAAKDDFISVYNRLMLDAVAKSKKPVWFLMQADNCVNRAAENKRAITEAVQNGYISNKAAAEMAESLGIKYTGGLKNLITRAPDNETRQKIQSLKRLFLGDKNGK